MSKITKKITIIQKPGQIKLFLKKEDKIKTILANSVCIERLKLKGSLKDVI